MLSCSFLYYLYNHIGFYSMLFWLLFFSFKKFSNLKYFLKSLGPLGSTYLRAVMLTYLRLLTFESIKHRASELHAKSYFFWC